MRLMLMNGVPTFESGKFANAFPAEMVRSVAV
jgi:hypothetical protein